MRSLYRLVPTEYMPNIMKNGLKPHKDCINGVYMFSIKDLKHWNQTAIRGSEQNIPNLLKALVEQVSSACGKSLSLLKINARNLDSKQLKIREQGILLCDKHSQKVFKDNLKIDSKKFENYVNKFMNRTQCSREEAEEVVKEAYADLEYSRYAFEGEPLSRAKVHTNNQKAIEYVYENEISPESVEVIGTCSDTKGKTLYEIFSDLTKGKKEAKHLWQLA